VPTPFDNMTLRDAIYGRSSVRAYEPGKIDRPTLQALLEAAVRAPTAIHAEPWHFVVVQDPALLKRLSDRAQHGVMSGPAHLHRGNEFHGTSSRPGFHVFHEAGNLVLICAKETKQFETADCWLAAQNLMLAAHALGLGSCVIGSAVPALNLPESKRELGIAPEITVVAPIILGKPRGGAVPSARKEPQIISWR